MQNDGFGASPHEVFTDGIAVIALIGDQDFGSGPGSSMTGV